MLQDISKQRIRRNIYSGAGEETKDPEKVHFLMQVHLFPNA